MQEDDRLRQLSAENEELRARIDELERVLFARLALPAEWRLTPQEARIVGCLLSRPVMSKDAGMAALYRNDGRDEAQEKIVDVFICKARKKLLPFGIEIHTQWGHGWYLDADTRSRIMAEIDPPAPESEVA